MSRASKLRRKRRKLVTRTLTILRRNLLTVAQAVFKDHVWGRTPSETAICVEAMLFTIAAEFEEWPDGWKHKHYMWPDGQCSCGHRISVTFDGVTPVDGTTLENRIYHLTRDLKLASVIVARAVTVYYAPWRIDYKHITQEPGGRLTSSPSQYMPIGQFDVVGQRGRFAIRNVRTDQDLTSLLEMGPRQR